MARYQVSYHMTWHGIILGLEYIEYMAWNIIRSPFILHGIGYLTLWRGTVKVVLPYDMLSNGLALYYTWHVWSASPTPAPDRLSRGDPVRADRLHCCHCTILHYTTLPCIACHRSSYLLHTSPHATQPHNGNRPVWTLDKFMKQSSIYF